MIPLILLSIAVVFVMIFALVLLIDESKPSQTIKSNVKDMMSFEDWSVRTIISKVAGVTITVGIVGLIMTQYWVNSWNKLIIMGSVFVITTTLTLLQNQFAKEEKNSTLIKDLLLIFQFFSTGAFLFTLNEFVVDSKWMEVVKSESIIPSVDSSHSLFAMGTTELLSIWIIITLVIAYLLRSSIMLVIGVVLNCVFFLNYYFNEINIIKDIFDYQYRGVPIPYHINYLTCFLAPFSLAVSFPILYAYHQIKQHDKGDLRERLFYHLTALMSYFSMGGLIAYSLWQQSNREAILQIVTNIFGGRMDVYGVPLIDILIALIVIFLFLSDQLLKKKPWYNINFTATFCILLFGISGYLYQPTHAFLGFYVLPIPIVLLLLGDYLRQKSKIAMVLYYIFNSILLWFLAVDHTRFDNVLLLLHLAIMIYAARLHPTNRLYNFYCVLMVIFGLTLGIFGISFSGFVFLISLGLISLLFSQRLLKK